MHPMTAHLAREILAQMTDAERFAYERDTWRDRVAGMLQGDATHLEAVLDTLDAMLEPVDGLRPGQRVRTNGMNHSGELTGTIDYRDLGHPLPRSWFVRFDNGMFGSGWRHGTILPLP